MRSLKVSMLVVLATTTMFLMGCAMVPRLPLLPQRTTARPTDDLETMIEARYTEDPRIGVIIINGSMPVIVNIFTEEDYKILNDKNIPWATKKEIKPIKDTIRDTGADPNPRDYAKPQTRILRSYELDTGNYYLRVEPYCYDPKTGNLIDKFKTQWIKVVVDDTPRDFIESRYTQQKWSWGVEINGGNIPIEYWDPKDREQAGWFQDKKQPWNYFRKEKKPWRFIDED